MYRSKAIFVTLLSVCVTIRVYAATMMSVNIDWGNVITTICGAFICWVAWALKSVVTKYVDRIEKQIHLTEAKHEAMVRALAKHKDNEDIIKEYEHILDNMFSHKISLGAN